MQFRNWMRPDLTGFEIGFFDDHALVMALTTRGRYPMCEIWYEGRFQLWRFTLPSPAGFLPGRLADGAILSEVHDVLFHASFQVPRLPEYPPQLTP